MPPKLLISGLGLANRHVGQGVYATRIVEGLVRRYPGFPFRVIAPADLDGLRRLVPSENLTELEGTPPIGHEMVAQFYWSKRIAAYAARHHPEAVFHSPSPIWAPARPVRTVVTLHDCIYRHFAHYLGRKLVRRWWIRATERYAAGAEMVLTDSEFSRNDLAAQAGIAPIKLQVLYPWVDQRSFDPIKDSTLTKVRARWGLPSRFWLYLGGYDYRKNVEFLIGAYAAARRESPNIAPLVLAGKIPQQRSATTCDVQGAIAHAGLPTEAIVQPGLVDHADLPALYRLASLFIYPSLMEGFGLPPAEAMAMGTPVLVSNTSSLPEVVRDPVCRFDPRNSEGLRLKLLEAATDESRFRRHLPEQFTEAAGLTQYLRVLGLQARSSSPT